MWLTLVLFNSRASDKLSTSVSLHAKTTNNPSLILTRRISQSSSTEPMTPSSPESPTPKLIQIFISETRWLFHSSMIMKKKESIIT